MLNIDTSSTCSCNMVNFGLLTAKICWRVSGTPANFNGFRVLAALLHGTLVVGVSQTAAMNRGRHLYSAGRPSRWASAHILVLHNLLVNIESNIYHFSFFDMNQSSTFHAIVFTFCFQNVHFAFLFSLLVHFYISQTALNVGQVYLHIYAYTVY